MSSESIRPVTLARFPSYSRRTVWTVIGTAAFSLFAVGAHADALQNRMEVTIKQKAVTYADLDLSKPTDAQALYDRLKRASNVVCGESDIRNLAMRQMHDQCSAEALADAVARVNASALTAVHAADERVRLAQRRIDNGPRS